MVANAPARADITPIWHAKWPAAVLVLGVAITWGASFPVVKSTVGEVSPPRLVGWRFVVATVTLLMLRPRVLYELNRRTLTHGSVLGALLGIGFVLCTVGMQTTSVLISAFVIGTTVVLAPLIAWVWLGHRLTTRAAAAVSLAFVGLAMITVRGFAVGPGTLLILAAAVLGRSFGGAGAVVTRGSPARSHAGPAGCVCRGRSGLSAGIRRRARIVATDVGVCRGWHRFPWGHCHRRRLPCVELGADAAGFDHDCGDLDPRAVAGSGPGRRPWVTPGP